MATIRERYQPVPMGVNASYTVRSAQIGGFLAKTAGTITVTTATGTVIVDAFPLTAGVYTPLPYLLTKPDEAQDQTAPGAVVQLAGGASGTLGF